jgi:hypothetical protein
VPTNVDDLPNTFQQYDGQRQQDKQQQHDYRQPSSDNRNYNALPYDYNQQENNNKNNQQQQINQNIQQQSSLPKIRLPSMNECDFCASDNRYNHNSFDCGSNLVRCHQCHASGHLYRDCKEVLFVLLFLIVLF